jgi:hypothetical protein
MLTALAATRSKKSGCEIFLNFRFMLKVQGCQMVYFQTKNTNLGKFWSFSQWKMMIHVMTIWSVLTPFGIFCVRSVHFMAIWYIFPRFGMLQQEKSGNPG